jgi:hypothetical protein
MPEDALFDAHATHEPQLKVGHALCFAWPSAVVSLSIPKAKPEASIRLCRKDAEKVDTVVKRLPQLKATCRMYRHG